MNNSLTPVRDEQYVRLKLKQPGNSILPPIMRNKSLSQLEQMADQLDHSRMGDDSLDNPYGNIAHSKSMMSNDHGGYNLKNSLGKGSNADFAVRSQMIQSKKVKSLGLGSKIHRNGGQEAGGSQTKNRPLVIQKNYQSQKNVANLADGKMNPKHYSYLKTKYFNQPGQNMNLKSQKVLESAQVVVSNFDPSVYRNQITELSIENNDMRNKIEKLNFDKYLLADTVNQQKIVINQLETKLSIAFNNSVEMPQESSRLNMSDVQLQEQSPAKSGYGKASSRNYSQGPTPDLMDTEPSQSPYHKPGRRLKVKSIDSRNKNHQSSMSMDQPSAIYQAEAYINATPAPVQAPPSNGEKEKLMKQIEQLNDLLTKQTNKLMDTENKLAVALKSAGKDEIALKEKFMKQICTLTDAVIDQMSKLTTAEQQIAKYQKECTYMTDLITLQYQTSVPLQASLQAKVTKCEKQISYLTDMLQLKVTGEVRKVPG